MSAGFILITSIFKKLNMELVFWLSLLLILDAYPLLRTYKKSLKRKQTMNKKSTFKIVKEPKFLGIPYMQVLGLITFFAPVIFVVVKIHAV